MKPTTILFIIILTILNFAYIAKFIQAARFSKIKHDTSQMEQIDVGKSALIANILILAFTLFIAISGFISSDADSIVIGTMFASAFVFQILTVLKQRFIYIGRTSFVFNGLNLKYKEIVHAKAPLGFVNTEYKITTNKQETIKIPVRAMEQIIPYLDAKILSK